LSRIFLEWTFLRGPYALLDSSLPTLSRAIPQAATELLLGFASLITLLVLSSGPVYAEWVAVGGNDEAGMTVYVDPFTIRRKGHLVKTWFLYDFKTVQTKVSNSFLSSRTQQQYDCAEERCRLLAVTCFSSNMEKRQCGF